VYCCEKCFSDKNLINYIQQNGSKNNCDFCGSKNIICINPVELKDLFINLIDLYTPFKNKYFIERNYSSSLGELIQNEWNIFNNILTKNDQNSLLDEIRNDKDDDSFYSSSKKWIDFKYEFLLKSGISYWGYLSEKLQTDTRFIIKQSDDETENFFNLLDETFSLAEKVISEKRKFYRARLGCDKEKKNYFSKCIPFKEMGAPPKDKSKPGRANPHGIPFLYLASDKETALSEVRPWKKAKVSIATFLTNQQLKIIDLTGVDNIKSPFVFQGNLKKEIEKRYFIKNLSSKLAKPVNPNNSNIEYIPTQFITEYIKINNYDGIKYKSAMGPGNNIVLFDENEVTKKDSYIFEVENINYKFKEYEN
jgi:hypothetical protein